MTSAIEDMNVQLEFIPIAQGGITSAAGFRAAGVHAGFKKKSGALDLAVVVSDKPCPAAAVFTQNVFCAAPVTVSREHLAGISYGLSQVIVINAGNANAATGDPGLQTARYAGAKAAELIGCSEHEVLMASTGVIGVVLADNHFEKGLPAALSQASCEGGLFAAQAIMTTDTIPKEYAIRYTSQDPDYEGLVFTVGGMVKGSGMIMPDMATLIAVITTDAPLSPKAAHTALTAAVNKSFNKVTVDSDTSTNDSCFLMASGRALPSLREGEVFSDTSLASFEFQAALDQVCINLARKVAADGEGATKLITVTVKGACNAADADSAARAIANSPLVKTAIFGHDANWGRVAMAIGKSGAEFHQEDVSITLMGIPVCHAGLSMPFDEEEALRRFEEPEITIEVSLGAGSAETTLWTCDYSHDYITINGDYRT